jgi:hypothetical protein
VVPKHRRSDLEPPLASARGGADPGWAAAPVAPVAPVPVAPVAAAASSWQELHYWQDWGPPPELHSDHPSAPVPRVRFPADHPSGPMPAVYAPVAPDRRETTGHGHQPGRGYPEASAYYETAGYQRQTGPGGQETTAFYHQAGPSGPRSEPPARPFQNQVSPNRDSIWTAGRVLTMADDQTARLTREAQDYAAAIREAAEREAAAITQHATSQAAAIREAAEREARELLIRLDSMSGELTRVAAYVTDNLAAPALPATAPAPLATAPAQPATAPAPPEAEPALPGPRSAPPVTRPAKPDSKPAGLTRPAKPETGPTGPRTRPASKPQTRPRQLQAMRIATYSSAALLSFAVISGVTEAGLHGFKFFVFRAGGVGQTPGNETDQQFLAREAAAAHHAQAPKGRHARKSHGTVEIHHK